MKREIKFRAWDGAYMLSGYLGGWVSFDGVPYTEAGRKYNTPYTEIETAPHYILMQFTGFKDKNGKEIYEGDIVREALIDHMEEQGWFWNYSVVEFEMGCWILKEIGYDYSNYENLMDHIHLYDSTDVIEVCGNIFENPELLSSNP